MNRALLSSSCDEWETPPDFFETLNAEFRFTLDPCALPETAKCPTYFTPDDDGLSRPWIAPGGGAVFCNPPYSRRTKDKPGQEDWIKKAAAERAGAREAKITPPERAYYGVVGVDLGQGQDFTVMASVPAKVQ